MNKVAKDLSKIAQELHTQGLQKDAWNVFFTACKVAFKQNPLVNVLSEFGFEPYEVFEHNGDGNLTDVDISDKSVHRRKDGEDQEIWMEWNPETGKMEYGYVHEGGEYGHKHAYYEDLDDLVAHIAEEDEDKHPCKTGGECKCGGSCRHASSDRKHKLNKPFRTPGGPKKFSVYVKNEKGHVVKVNFGDPKLSIKRDQPGRRKNFRARHHCESPGPKTKAKYWSCRMWSKPSVTSILKGKK
jgi:hypothetical protein